MIRSKPLRPRKMLESRAALERVAWHLRGDAPAHTLVRKLIEKIDLELLDREKLRLREKGYRF